MSTLKKLERSIRKRRKLIFGDKSAGAGNYGASAKRREGGRAYDKTKSNVLVVSHDASATGCPILAYSIIKDLCDRYNVTVVCLGGGELLSALQEFAVELWTDKRRFHDYKYYTKSLAKSVKGRQFEYAIVNSIESRHVLEAFSTFKIPTVSLIHEFASYTHRGKEALEYTFNCASAVVFSADIVMRNALSATGYNRKHNVFKLAQGRCQVPSLNCSVDDKVAEREKLKAVIRPEGIGERFVVIGAGSVDYRKGVDLFLEVAQKSIRSYDVVNVAFFWFGGGYTPDEEDIYSMYIKDQIERSGLSDKITMMKPTSEIDYVYELSDALLLTGRMDPLPNVAIDSLSKETPVLCFDRTTGIVDYLEEAGLGDTCVASYLDVDDMASKLAGLVKDKDLYKVVINRIKDDLSNEFCMQSYLRNLEAIALAQREDQDIKANDATTIVSSKNLRRDFLILEDNVDLEDLQIVENYIEETKLGLGVRRPEPGFNSTMYLESLHGEELFVSDPYAEFLRSGRPEGPWMQEVLTEQGKVGESVTSLNGSVALHIHVHYVDVLEDVFKRLQYNSFCPEIFITLSDKNSVEEVYECAQGYNVKLENVVKTPNIGRDVGPFLTEFLKKLDAKYEIVGHLHTKKSLFTGGDTVGKVWSNFLFENLLGGENGGAMMDKVLTKFAEDSSIGMVYPSDPNIVSWTKNDWIAEEYSQKMGYGKLPNEVNFPIGTMFWSRVEALRPFIDLDLHWSDYPVEPVGIDGTMLHALERLFGYVPGRMGLKSVVTNVRGVTR